MPSQDILRQIHWIPTYTESYTPTRLDIRCSLINYLIIIFIIWLLITPFYFLLYNTPALLPRTLWYQNPLSTEEFLRNAYWRESGGKSRSGCESLPRTTKVKLLSSLRANHWRRYWTPKDPKVWLAAELDSRVCTLHKQDPGARARAPRQEGVQSGCRGCQYQ